MVFVVDKNDFKFLNPFKRRTKIGMAMNYDTGNTILAFICDVLINYSENLRKGLKL